MSVAQKKRFKDPKNHPNYGKHFIGKDNPNYKDGRSPIVATLRHCKKSENWRKAVFKKDNYICQDCGQAGGQLVAHHKIAFSVIFDEFIMCYSYLSITKDKDKLILLAFTYESFWDINNGKTVCDDCHKTNYTTRP